MRRYDDDRSGVLELAEFRKLVKELRAYTEGDDSGGDDEVDRAFRRADADGSGDIDVLELKDALRDLGIDTNTDQARTVMRKYDSDGSGRIEQKEFRAMYKEIKAFRGGDDDIETEFRRADTDGSGDIDEAELMDVLRKLNITADRSQVRVVMRKYDEGKGSLRLPQFRLLVKDLRQFKGGSGARSPQAPSALDDDIARTFRRFDDDDSGDIDVSELTKALRSLGINADGAQARQVMQRFAERGSGTLKLPQFRALVTELRSFKGR
jgi:Ca2+-binding EF-hand superfamily protein